MKLQTKLALQFRLQFKYFARRQAPGTYLLVSRSMYTHLCVVLFVFAVKVAPIIKERMMKGGSMMVGYQPLGDKVNFFRAVVFSPLVTQKDVDFLLDEIERLGNDL